MSIERVAKQRLPQLSRTSFIILFLATEAVFYFCFLSKTTLEQEHLLKRTDIICIPNTISVTTRQVHANNSSRKMIMKDVSPPVQGNWCIQASSFAINSINPIRQIVENLNVSPNPDKKLIPLSIGEL